MLQRILFITDSLMAGGTEHQLITLIAHLNREQFIPYVVCFYGGQAGRSLHFLDDLQKLDVSILVLDLKWGFRDKLYALIAVARAVWQIRPHIIQAVNYHSNLISRVARPFMPCSVRLIGCIYVEYSRKQLFYEHISGWICNQIVCNTVQIQHQLPQYISTQVIPNGVEIERFAYNPDPTLRARLSSHAVYLLLVLGRITRQKSPHLLIEAIGILKQQDQLEPGIEVWVVGESEDPAAQYLLDETIRRHNLENAVFQFPPTTIPEIYYHAADIVVLPSLWEGLPNVILKSLATGTPLIVTEAANIAGIIREGLNGWIVQTNEAQSLAEGLRRAFVSNLSDMSSYCQKSAVPFSVTKMTQEYEALYAKLIARS